MATDTIGLPEGFILDEPMNLPEGFVLDTESEPNVYVGLTPQEVYDKAGEVWDVSSNLAIPTSRTEQHFDLAKERVKDPDYIPEPTSTIAPWIKFDLNAFSRKGVQRANERDTAVMSGFINYIFEGEGEIKQKIAALGDGDLEMVARSLIVCPAALTPNIEAAIYRERKVRATVDVIRNLPDWAESAYIIAQRRANLFNIHDFTSRTLGIERLWGLTGGETSIAIEAAERVVAEKNQKDAISLFRALDIGAGISQVLLEFAAIPDVTSKIAAFDKLPKIAQRVISTATRFGLREAVSLPREGETIGERAKEVGISTATGAVLGATGGKIVNPFLKVGRVAGVTGGFMGITAARGGDVDQIIETGVMVLGFQAYSLIRSTSAKLRVKMDRAKLVKAIKAVRSHNPDLKGIPDKAIGEVIEGHRKISWWQNQYKKGKVTEDVMVQRVNEQLAKIQPIGDAIAKSVGVAKQTGPQTIQEVLQPPTTPSKPLTKAEATITPPKAKEAVEGIEYIGIKQAQFPEKGRRWYVQTRNIKEDKIYSEALSQHFATKKQAEIFLAEAVPKPIEGKAEGKVEIKPGQKIFYTLEASGKTKQLYVAEKRGDSLNLIPTNKIAQFKKEGYYPGIWVNQANVSLAPTPKAEGKKAFEMTKQEFIEAHRGQFVKEKGRRVFAGIQTVDGVTTFSLPKGSQKGGKLLKPADEILADVFDAHIAPQQGKPSFMEKLKQDLTPTPKAEGKGKLPETASGMMPLEKPKFKTRPGFVDLTPIAKAGKQIKTTSEAATKHIVRFGGLTPDVRKVFIEYEEQIRNLPKVISKREDVQEFIKLTKEQEEILQQHREQPKKFPDLPKELAPRLKELETAIDEYGARLEELGYTADWPNQYLERLEKKLAKEEAKEIPNEQMIVNLKEAIKESQGLEYLHHYYNPTLEKAKELGLEPAPLAVSHAHMIYSVERAEMANDLIRAINENPNLSLPEKDAPEDWVRLDTNIFPASVQQQMWVEEGRPRMKKTFRKYPLPIAEALAEITYSRGNEALERAYDKLNFGMKIIGFYNPIHMTKNDAVQMWRAAGVKGVLPLVLPRISRGGGKITIDLPKAIKIWAEKGPEYEKLRKAGLFNNVVSYTPPVTEIVSNMVRAARETGGEKAARIVGNILNPLSIVRALRKFNDMSTWNMDEIMRIATYETVKNSAMLAEMTDFEKIEWVNDALVNYGKMPKATKRWLSKALFVPTYRVSNFRFFFGELNRVFKGEWRHVAPVIRTVAYKSFIQWGLPAVISAAIFYKTDEERDVRTEKGYRLVVHNPKTNIDTVYALSDPLLEGAKVTQRTLRHTIGLNLAPLPHLLVRAMAGPRRMTSDDPFGEFFKLGTPIYRDIINWRDPNTTVPQKILTQLAIAFVYQRRARESDKQTVVESLAKGLSIWTDWKEQAADLKQMISGRSYYLGPGGKFGRLLRQFDMERDIDRSKIDENIDDKLMQGNYVDAVKIMMEDERYATVDGIAGRIESIKTPVFRYWNTWSDQDRMDFISWLIENKKYEGKEIEELQKALDKIGVEIKFIE